MTLHGQIVQSHVCYFDHKCKKCDDTDDTLHRCRCSNCPPGVQMESPNSLKVQREILDCVSCIPRKLFPKNTRENIVI